MKNQKSESRNQKSDDTPVGVMILTLMPFVWVFMALIERGLR